jgi:zinc/manganese transport system substrate-binding protein
MTRYRTLSALFTLLVVLLAPRLARADLDVVATVPTLAAVAKEVGGDHVSVTSMSLPTQDPHFVDAKPSLALKLRNADLLLAVGLSLEVGWLPTLQKGARNAEILVGSKGFLDCSTFVKVLEVPETVDRSQGDIHPGGNPHYLYDPRQIAQVAIGVAGRMGELDPDHADAYNENLKTFLKHLNGTRKKLEKKLKEQRGTAIVSYHRSFVYLSDWLGLNEVAYLEPKPGIPPSPAHVAEVLATAKKQGVKIVVQESFYPDATGKLVAEKAGAGLVLLPSGVDFDNGETVTKWLKRMVGAVGKELGV